MSAANTVNMKQREQVHLYLLWCFDGERSTLLDVYTDEAQAQEDMHILNKEPYEGFTYSITQRRTVPHRWL
jgi:hypothetical protein